jgi:heme/copper-type cytochrome/quinol oxidase subunit 2
MKKVCIAILLIFTVGCVKQKLMSLEGMPPDSPVKKIMITGEDCGWSPNLVKVKQGTHVILEVESADWDYNFRLAYYDLVFEIPEGKKVTAEFYASKAGDFEFGCYIETGKKYFWGGMVGKIVVE